MGDLFASTITTFDIVQYLYKEFIKKKGLNNKNKFVNFSQKT